MALFGKKPPSGGGNGGGGTGTGSPDSPNKGPEPSPEKAARFFEHARTSHETTGYEYAMQLWLKGMAFQPTNLEALKHFFESAAAFLGSKEGAKGPSKDTIKQFQGRSEIDRYLAALLQWGARPNDPAAATAATVAAGTAGLIEPVRWLGERAIACALRQPKPQKKSLVQLFEVLAKFSAYDLAVVAGEAAVRLDPADSRLAAEVRNMAAQQSISKGGFDQVGEAGGFRANIRDADKQKRLEAEERMVKTEQTLDHLVQLAKADYEARPGDKPAIRKYVERLLERGRPEDEETAHTLLMQAYEATQEYGFREKAGELRIRQARRRVNKLQAEAERAGGASGGAGGGGNGTLTEALEKARRDLLIREIDEYESRVKAYPTDLGVKFELGKRFFDAGRYEESIGLLQEAKAEVKNRTRVMLLLGQAFEKIEFHDGAIETFREALDIAANSDPDMVIEIRYGLMSALKGRAAETSDLASAEEAYKLASAIAIQQFNFRDVRARQLELKQMIASMKG